MAKTNKNFNDLLDTLSKLKTDESLPPEANSGTSTNDMKVEALDKRIRAEGIPAAEQAKGDKFIGFKAMTPPDNTVLEGKIAKPILPPAIKEKASKMNPAMKALIQKSAEDDAIKRSIQAKMKYAESGGNPELGIRGTPIIGSAAGLIGIKDLAQYGIAPEEGRSAMGLNPADLTTEEQQWFLDHNKNGETT